MRSRSQQLQKVASQNRELVTYQPIQKGQRSPNRNNPQKTKSLNSAVNSALAMQPSPSHHHASNLYGLSTISGQWTRARLLKHFTEQQITSAISRNVLTEDRIGTIRAVPGKTRLLEQDLQPGEMVVRMVDGKPIQMMVVRDDQGNTQLVNPEAPNEPQQSVPEDELITPDELEGLKDLGVEPGGDKGTYSNPLAESLLENSDTGPRGFSDAIRAGAALAKADPYYGQPDEEPEQPTPEADDEQWPTLQAAADRYGEQKIVQFIYNRHCSRFDPSSTSLEDAIDMAWQYHTTEDEILEDFRTVDSYGDLDQYMRR